MSSTTSLNVQVLFRLRRWSPWSATKRCLIDWRNRRQSRFELATLADHELWDLGMTRSAAEFEANKPFWRE